MGVAYEKKINKNFEISIIFYIFAIEEFSYRYQSRGRQSFI